MDRGSVTQERPTDQETAELLQTVSELRQGIPYADKRACAIISVLLHRLHIPAAVELLRQERQRAPFNRDTADLLRQCDQSLAALDAPAKRIVRKPKKKRTRSKPGKNAVVRGDPELARLFAALYLPEGRLWLIARHLIRQLLTEGKADNYVTTDMLYAALKPLGIDDQRANFRLLLKAGQGRFWNIYQDRIYIVGYDKVAAACTRLAIQRGKPGLIAADRPGARDFYIPVGGTIKQFYAHVYACWLAANENPIISRQTLMTLWNRSRQQLQAWEAAAGIKVAENFAQTTDGSDPSIPLHALYGRFQASAEQEIPGVVHQRPNTYEAPPRLREHGHKGQGRKIRKTVNDICEADLHPDNVTGAHSNDVRNFDSLKAYRAAWKHTAPDDTRTDYLKLGQADRRRRNGKRIIVWERMNGRRDPQTSVGDYIPTARHQRSQYYEI